MFSFPRKISCYFEAEQKLDNKFRFPFKLIYYWAIANEWWCHLSWKMDHFGECAYKRRATNSVLNQRFICFDSTQFDRKQIGPFAKNMKLPGNLIKHTLCPQFFVVSPLNKKSNGWNSWHSKSKIAQKGLPTSKNWLIWKCILCIRIGNTKLSNGKSIGNIGQVADLDHHRRLGHHELAVKWCCCRHT